MQTIKKASLMLLLITISFGQSINFEEKTEPGHELVIKLKDLKGSITIEGWDKKSIQIKGKMDDEEKKAQLKKLSKGYSLQLKYVSGYYDDDRLDVDLTIMVPKNYNLSIDTKTALNITDVRGEFDISIANDNAIMKKIKGSGEISVVNGTFDIFDSDFNGSVQNVNGELTVKNSDFRGRVNTTNANMKLSRAPDGLKVKSVNGNISFESIGKFIEAKTTNGNLAIGQLNGSLEFESINGSVEFMLVGDSKKGNHGIDIETLNGSADITLADDFSMSFDIKIEEKNDYLRKAYTVKTDFKNFNINTNSDDEDEYEVVASGKIADGKNKAKLRIINGNVRIKKQRN